MPKLKSLEIESNRIERTKTVSMILA
jgi:Leucine-rich repeat (LRR) protein